MEKLLETKLCCIQVRPVYVRVPEGGLQRLQDQRNIHTGCRVVAGWRSINQTQNQLYWQVVFTCKEFDCFFYYFKMLFTGECLCCVALMFPWLPEVGRTLHMSWVWWIWIHVLTRVSPEWTDESFFSYSLVRSKSQSDGCAENTSPELQYLVWREKSSGVSTDPWGAPGAAASCLPGRLTLTL